MPLQLPDEIVDEILVQLGTWAGKPALAYKASTYLRRPRAKRLIESLIRLPSVDEASSRGFVDVLELHRLLGYNLYSDVAMDLASKYGHIDVLEWWRVSSGSSLYWTRHAVEWASAFGHVDVLQWWKNSELGMEWNDMAVEMASKNGRAEVVEWWSNSGLEKIKNQ
ncbi:hypothetical protein BJ742DRAFT_777712 [Cladochytrium replicatum]|nr:hypothetical protein BJ742DRAFT_777712 [Cladochytrium replicatum]